MHMFPGNEPIIIPWIPDYGILNILGWSEPWAKSSLFTLFDHCDTVHLDSGMWYDANSGWA